LALSTFHIDTVTRCTKISFNANTQDATGIAGTHQVIQAANTNTNLTRHQQWAVAIIGADCHQFSAEWNARAVDTSFAKRTIKHATAITIFDRNTL
jgi:hypothetical protein